MRIEQIRKCTTMVELNEFEEEIRSEIKTEELLNAIFKSLSLDEKKDLLIWIIEQYDLD